MSECSPAPVLPARHPRCGRHHPLGIVDLLAEAHRRVIRALRTNGRKLMIFGSRASAAPGPRRAWPREIREALDVVAQKLWVEASIKHPDLHSAQYQSMAPRSME
jgi:hypothetical protein